MKKIIALLTAVMLIATLAISASAQVSPAKYFNMTAQAIGSGEATVNPARVEVDETTGVAKETVTFTATEKGSDFVKWEFYCEFDAISGTVTKEGDHYVSTDKELVLLPKTDIRGVAYFADADKATPSQATTTTTSTTSPKTGDMTLVFAGIALLAIGASVFAVKKIKE